MSVLTELDQSAPLISTAAARHHAVDLADKERRTVSFRLWGIVHLRRVFEAVVRLVVFSIARTNCKGAPACAFRSKRHEAVPPSRKMRSVLSNVKTMTALLVDVAWEIIARQD